MAGRRKQEAQAKDQGRAVQLQPKPQQHEEQEEQRLAINELKEERAGKEQQEHQGHCPRLLPRNAFRQADRTATIRQREKVGEDQTGHKMIAPGAEGKGPNRQRPQRIERARGNARRIANLAQVKGQWAASQVAKCVANTGPPCLGQC